MIIDLRGTAGETSPLFNMIDRQVKFAAAKALTMTATQAKRAVDIQIPIKLDRPKPFTKRAIGIKRASKINLQADVFVKDIQWRYLKYAIDGGVRTPSGRAIATPGSKTKLNKFGNMTRGKAHKLLANRRKYFSGKPKGMPDAPAGIWQRMGKGGRKNIRLVVEYKQSISYQKRLPFYRIVEGVVQNRFDRNFEEAYAEALRTAR